MGSVGGRGVGARGLTCQHIRTFGGATNCPYDTQSLGRRGSPDHPSSVVSDTARHRVREKRRRETLGLSIFGGALAEKVAQHGGYGVAGAA